MYYVLVFYSLLYVLLAFDLLLLIVLVLAFDPIFLVLLLYVLNVCTTILD